MSDCYMALSHWTNSMSYHPRTRTDFQWAYAKGLIYQLFFKGWSSRGLQRQLALFLYKFWKSLLEDVQPYLRP